jgi:hypothetical protein
MSTDKLPALHEALADVFSESPLIPTHTEPSHPVFDHEALSEIFSDLISTNREQSSPIFDHAALAGIFSKPLPISTNTKPSPLSFDHQALAEILSELRPVPINPQPSPLIYAGSSSSPLSGQLDNGEPVAKIVAVAPSTNAESARPQQAKSLLARLHNIFSTKAEPPPSSVEKDPSSPSLSGQLHKLEPVANAIAAAAPTDTESARPQQAKALLTELSSLISTNSELPPLSFEQESSSPRPSGQPGNVRPAVSDLAATSPTDTASARPPRGTSLLAETSSLISINTESSPPIFEKKSSPPTVAGRLNDLDPGVEAVAVAAPADAENARPQQARSLLTELRPLTSASTKPPPIVEREPSRLTLSGRVGNVETAVKTVAVAPPTDAESARAQRARSLLVEPVPPTSTNIEPSPPIFGKEPSRPILSGRLGDVEPAEKPDVESAQPQQASSSLTELLPLISTNTKPPPPIFETEPSQSILSGQLDNLEPAANASPTDAERAGAPQAKSFPTELPPLVSINTESSPPIREKETSRPTLSGQPDNVEPAAEIVLAAPPTDTESVRPSLLAELPLLISRDTKPSPPNFQKKPSPPTLSGQLDNVGPAASTVAAVPPTNAESARPQRATSLLAELPPMISANAKPPLPIFEKEPSRPTSSSQMNNLEPAAKTVSFAPPTDAESAVMQPREAEPLLSEVPSLDSTNTKPPPLIFENEPSPIFLSGQPDHAEPAAKIVAAAPPADAEGARPQQGKSLLAELPPSRSFFEREPSPTTLFGELDNVAPAVKTVAVAPPTHAVAMQPQQTKSLPLTDLPSLVSTNTEPSPPIFDQEALAGILSKPPPISTNRKPSPPIFDREALAEIFSKPRPISTTTKPSHLVFDEEPSRSTLFGPLDNVGVAAKTVAVVPSTVAESAVVRAQQAKLAELPPLISTTTKPSHPVFDKQPSRPTLSGQPDNVGPAVKTVAVAPPTDAESAVMRAQQAKPLLAELPPLISTTTKPSHPVFDKQPSRPTLSGQPDNVGPSVKTVVVAHPTEAESALPQQANSLLAALRALIPTNAKPSPPILEKEPSRSTLAGQPDSVGLSVKTVVVAHPIDAESALPQQAKSLLTEMPALISTDAKPAPPIFEKEPSRPPLSDQPANVEPAAKTVAVAAPADTESAVTRAQQAKSLLAELDLNTAIRLRWVMRDIRSKRTKLSPVSDNDLTALMDLGLVEMREELPRLSALGVLALD